VAEEMPAEKEGGKFQTWDFSKHNTTVYSSERVDTFNEKLARDLGASEYVKCGRSTSPSRNATRVHAAGHGDVLGDIRAEIQRSMTALSQDLLAQLREDLQAEGAKTREGFDQIAQAIISKSKAQFTEMQHSLRKDIEQCTVQMDFVPVLDELGRLSAQTEQNMASHLEEAMRSKVEEKCDSSSKLNSTIDGTLQSKLDALSAQLQGISRSEQELHDKLKDLGKWQESRAELFAVDEDSGDMSAAQMTRRTMRSPVSTSSDDLMTGIPGRTLDSPSNVQSADSGLRKVLNKLTDIASGQEQIGNFIKEWKAQLESKVKSQHQAAMLEMKKITGNMEKSGGGWSPIVTDKVVDRPDETSVGSRYTGKEKSGSRPSSACRSLGIAGTPPGRPASTLHMLPADHSLS